MRIGMPLSYSSSFMEAASALVEYESVGLDLVVVAEVYTFDAVSQLGFLAARTTTLEIASGILNVFSRTPALLAMTAAGLDHVSQGRFMLGIGASGPQVVEGFHGVPYKEPVARTREVVEICRMAWRQVPLEFDGRHFQLPLEPDRGGSGMGKPLKMINKPVRPRVPMMLAALGPKNVALAAELFEAWEPVFYYPEGSKAAFGEALAAGTSRRDPGLGPLQVIADTHALITDDPQAEERALRRIRDFLALYVGGMGAKGRNFYFDLAGRYGFARQAEVVQGLYLSGRKAEAAAALPDEFVRGVSLIGPRARVAERVAAFAESGVSTLNVTPLGEDHQTRLQTIASLKELA
ncbi:LLM class F420-dependent oxidoreductase [Pseudonocardia sp. N23]|uniref:LLM class F420-dependent oxidoreductase n=1 Tax=Pseudonocardia sp. N23 TaxID=1987376 RepID=UPI000BFCE604|nr:LLM class F420-dependent oxidoreductase [Pseudonocardia sp. N23]GAY10856.1 N5,N10-methylenetetrahydromethanopterin reductase-related protein [Pseudonocardia sp. N23]